MQPTERGLHARHLSDLPIQPARVRPLPEGVGMSTVRLTADQFHAHRLAARGYLIKDQALWYIANDDYDQGLELQRVADWTGTPVDAWFQLVAHGFPCSEDEIFCPECEDAEVSFGEICPACSVQVVEEVRGENAYEHQAGK